MQIIGTHDSATGEKGDGLLSWLVTPFARTQSKTLKEQYEAGARFFDIRVKRHKGRWHCAHGLWRSKAIIWDIMHILTNDLPQDKQIYFCLTLEGTEKDLEKFKELCHQLHKAVEDYTNVHLTTTAVKLPKWHDMRCYHNIGLRMHHCFVTLDYSTWHTFLPIPWLWHKVYDIKPQDGCINLYDFI